MYTQTYIHIHTCRHIDTYVNVQYRYIHAHLDRHTYTYMHMEHTFTQTYMHKYMDAHICECICMHLHVHAFTCTGTHTQAHTYSLPMGYRPQDGALLEAGPLEHILPHRPKLGNGFVPEVP